MENKKWKAVYRTIMLVIVVSIVTFIVTNIVSYEGNRKYIITARENADINEQLETALSAISEIIEEKYIGDIDKQKLIDGALKGMVESVGDVYTEYYTKEELEDFSATTLGNFVGIGVYMQADLENDVVVIQAPIENSPAEKAGLKTGDQILKVDGKEYKAEDIDDMSNHIKGEEGTEVELTIKRGEETFDIKVKRGAVHINYVVSKKLEDNIGYIYIETFDEGCKEDFLNAYNKLVAENIKSLIIDLRYNGGGLVDEALDIAELICDKDDIMLIASDKDGKKEITKSKKAPIINMPIVLLTNGATASASEIVAAALKDNEKAEIVGETTYGKGVIQELIYLSNGGAVKVTSAEYYTPKEEKINEIGIKANYEVKGIEEQEKKAVEILKEKMK